MPSPRTLPSLPEATLLELTDSMIVQQAGVTRRMPIALLKDRVEVDNTTALNALNAAVNAALTAQNATFQDAVDDVESARDTAITQLQTLAKNQIAVFTSVTSSRNLVSGLAYALDAASGVVDLTLPANPASGDAILIMDMETVGLGPTYTIRRNGRTIRGLAEDMIIDVPGVAFYLRWNGSDWRVF